MVNDNIFAVDIGGSKLICGVLSPDGTILDTCRLDYGRDFEPEQIFDAIALFYDRLKIYRCRFCGVAIPGLADSKCGVWLYSPFSGLSDIPAQKLVSRITGLPTYIDNDVNLCAMAEKYYGRCAELDDFLWITVSNGIGGGLFLGGKLYTGHGMSAGEIGHIVVDEMSRRVCGCGKRGCLEAMASGASISEIYRDTAGVSLTAKDIADRARHGEKAASRVFHDAGYYIGKAAASAVNLLNLQAVVFGGGVTENFDIWQDAVTEAFERFVFIKANPDVKIIQSGLGYYAALTGCAALIKYNID